MAYVDVRRIGMVIVNCIVCAALWEDVETLHQVIQPAGTMEYVTRRRGGGASMRYRPPGPTWLEDI